MKIFGEKDVLLMTELKIDTMSQNETTKLDIIVEVLGEREPEIRRLVILDDRLRMFAESNDENGPGIPIELVAEWAMLLNKYYPLFIDYTYLCSLNFSKISPSSSSASSGLSAIHCFAASRPWPNLVSL